MRTVAEEEIGMTDRLLLFAFQHQEVAVGVRRRHDPLCDPEGYVEALLDALDDATRAPAPVVPD